MVKANPDPLPSACASILGYMVNGTICEVGNVLINGAKVMTIVGIHGNRGHSKTSGHRTRGVENINYLQAIKRVIGMSDKPLANE